MQFVYQVIRMEVIYSYYRARNEWMSRQYFIDRCGPLRAEWRA